MTWYNIENMKITPYSLNAKKHPKKQVEQVANSIKEFGMNQPIVVDKQGVIIVGHGRYEALQSLGWEVKDEWVKIVDLTEEQAKAYRLADNKLNESDWDMKLVIEELKGLSEEMLDLTGFDKDLIIEADEKDDEVPETPEEPQSKLGDLYELGQHRVLCGDSTKIEDVERLMNGEKADLLLTDPPYGIDYGNQLIKGYEFKQKTNKHGWRNFGNPEWDKSKPESGVLQYLCQITDNQIIWGGNYFTDDLPPTMGWLVWDKGQRGFSLADGEMAWTSFNNALRIKEYARAKSNREEKNHPTQKPVEIMSWCFEYADRHSKNEVKLVLDAYLGSGTTMVASHQLKRKCYGMELDPKYTDVIVQRYVDYTGNESIIKNGQTITWQKKK